MAKKKDDGLSAAQKIEIGIGLTTAAVAAAGAYFLYGSNNAAKNRKTVKSWMLKAKAEVLEQLEEAKSMTKSEFADVVAAVSSNYSHLKNASKKDIAEFTEEMMQHWHKLEKELAPKKKPAKKAAKKAPAKKAAKKTTKKAAKKSE